MPDDQNITQNQDSEENSIPASPQEPTEPSSENTAHSEPSVALPVTGGRFLTEVKATANANAMPHLFSTL